MVKFSRILLILFFLISKSLASDLRMTTECSKVLADITNGAPLSEDKEQDLSNVMLVLENLLSRNTGADINPYTNDLMLKMNAIFIEKFREKIEMMNLNTQQLKRLKKIISNFQEMPDSIYKGIRGRTEKTFYGKIVFMVHPFVMNHPLAITTMWHEFDHVLHFISRKKHKFINRMKAFWEVERSAMRTEYDYIREFLSSNELKEFLNNNHKFSISSEYGSISMEELRNAGVIIGKYNGAIVGNYEINYKRASSILNQNEESKLKEDVFNFLEKRKNDDFFDYIGDVIIQDKEAYVEMRLAKYKIIFSEEMFTYALSWILRGGGLALLGSSIYLLYEDAKDND